jgi:hypothetical protein
VRASCTWLRCWTRPPAGSSGSPWGSIMTRSWPTPRWSWRWRCAAGTCRGWSCTPIMPRLALSRGIVAWPVRAGLAD